MRIKRSSNHHRHWHRKHRIRISSHRLQIPTPCLTTYTIPFIPTRTCNTSFRQLPIPRNTHTSIPIIITIRSSTFIISFVTSLTIKCSTWRTLLASLVNPEESLWAYALSTIPLLVLLASWSVYTTVISAIPFKTWLAYSWWCSTFATVPVVVCWASLAVLMIYRIKSWYTLTVDSIKNRVIRTIIILIHFLTYITNLLIPMNTDTLNPIKHFISPTTISRILTTSIQPDQRCLTNTSWYFIIPITIRIRTCWYWASITTWNRIIIWWTITFTVTLITELWAFCA